MKHTNLHRAVLALSLALGLPLAIAQPIAAQETQPKPEPPEQPGKAIQPFHGNAEAIDTAAKTLTVGGQVIYVAESTKLSKQGKAIQLSDILTGDKVDGTARMTFDGKLEALTILVTPVK
jgi:hypothetical protein